MRHATAVPGDLVAVASIDHFPFEMATREPSFDQMIVNVYSPGTGIRDHVDLAKFDDGIVSVSLGASCVMNFTRADTVVPILLEPGDLLLLHGEARYQWMHGIPETTVDVWKGNQMPRGKRTSVTLRRLLPIEQRPTVMGQDYFGVPMSAEQAFASGLGGV